MKKLIIIRGIPGAGKTTFADFLFDFLSDELDLTICAADDYYYDEDGNYNFDSKQIYNAHLSCQQNVELAMQRGNLEDSEGSVIMVHNTSTAAKEVKTYTDLAAKYGYEVTSLIVENRHGNTSVHNVPDDVLDRMRSRFEVKL